MFIFLELALTLLLGGLLFLFISTAWLEKQWLHQFLPAPPGQSTTGSPYFVAMNEAAGQLGFNFAGVFLQHRGSRLYKARIALWIAPDGQSILRIAGGKTAGMPLKRTTLTSFVQPGRILETTDEVGTSDLSGLTDRRLVLNADLNELFFRHQARLAECPGQKRGFSAAGALAAFEELEAMRATELERLGLAKFLNPARTIWRHTFKGAIWHLRSLDAGMEEGKSQRDRIALKRPGQK